MFFISTRAFHFTVVVSIFILIFHINNGSTLSLSVYSVFATTENNSDSLVINQGIASGDVTDDSAVVWSRSNREAQMHVEYDTNSNFSQPRSTDANTIGNQTTDYTSHVKLRN